MMKELDQTVIPSDDALKKFMQEWLPSQSAILREEVRGALRAAYAIDFPSPAPKPPVSDEWRDQIEAAAQYLDALSANMLANDADQLLDPCDDPATIAERLRAIIS